MVAQVCKLYLTHQFHEHQQPLDRSALAAFDTHQHNTSSLGCSASHLTVPGNSSCNDYNASKGSLQTTNSNTTTGCSPVSLYKLPSNLSTTSSQLIQFNNAAFNKLRTAFIQPKGNGDGARDGVDYSERGCNVCCRIINEADEPSMAKGHWRSFGPTEALLTSVSAASPDQHTNFDYKKWTKRLHADRYPSSLWHGTIWLTDTNLVFVQEADTLPEVQQPKKYAEQCVSSEKHMTSNWIAALKRALKPKEAVSECIADVRGGDNDETNRNTAPIQCPRTGRSYTAFQIPLNSIRKVSQHQRSDSTFKSTKRRFGSKSNGRSSIAGSSTQYPLSRTGTLSATTSPALSRSQTRRSERSYKTDTPGAQNFDDEASTGGPPIDFAQLVNKTVKPYVVTVLSSDQETCSRTELRFMSSLYAQEAQDLATRLRAHVYRR